MTKRALVVGATGIQGTAVAERLVGEGWKVFGLARTPSQQDGVTPVAADLLDPATLGEMRIFTYCSTNIQALARKTDPTFSAFETVFTSLRFNDPALRIDLP